MKKFVLFLAFSAMVFPATSFAGDLVTGIALSKNVEGVYKVNDATTRSAYSFTVGHTQGNKVYGTSSDDSLIYNKNIAGDAFASTDLISTYQASFDSVSGFTY